MTLKARLTALIDQANAFIEAGFLLPCKVEAVALECDVRVASVWVRFDDGMLSRQCIAATPLDVTCLLNAAQAAFLFDFLCIDPDEHDEPADVTAFATGYQPKAATEDGRPVTHPAPEVIQ